MVGIKREVDTERLLSLEKKVHQLAVDNAEMKKQLVASRFIISKQDKELREAMEKKKENKRGEGGERKRKVTNISKQALDAEIDKILANEDSNAAYIPDFVEKKIYENVLSLVLGLVDSMLNETSISFLGHRIVMDIVSN